MLCQEFMFQKLFMILSAAVNYILNQRMRLFIFNKTRFNLNPSFETFMIFIINLYSECSLSRVITDIVGKSIESLKQSTKWVLF